MPLSHPPKHKLMEYSEGLVFSTARLNPNVATHVKKCAKCQQEVAEMRRTICVLNGIEEIEPSAQFTADILRASRSLPRKRRSTFAIVRTAAVAASFAAFAAIVPAYVMQSDLTMPELPSINGNSSSNAVLVMPVSDTKSVSQEESLLVPAVMGDHRELDTAWEQAQHRALNAYDDDIAEAELAYSNNRALTRASALISETRARKARTLKDVYTEGP